MSSSCINPIIYGYGNENYRKGFLDILSRLRPCKKSKSGTKKDGSNPPLGSDTKGKTQNTRATTDGGIANGHVAPPPPPAAAAAEPPVELEVRQVGEDTVVTVHNSTDDPGEDVDYRDEDEEARAGLLAEDRIQEHETNL